MQHLVDEVAKATNVSSADVKKIFEKLGLDTLSKETAAVLGQDKLSQIQVGQLKLAVRLGRSAVCV